MIIELLGCPVQVLGHEDLLADLLGTLPPISVAAEGVVPWRTWVAARTGDGVFLGRQTDGSTVEVDPDGAPDDVSGEVTMLGIWPDRADALKVLGSEVELYAAEHSPTVVVIHAGAVAHHGRGLLLPGRTLAGKSTLTAALLDAGATYYSDEFALLTPDGLLLPYPRPLSLRAGWSRAPRGGGLVAAAERGAPTGVEAIPVGIVARLAYREGSSLAVEELSPGLTSLALIDNAVAARHQPAAVLAATARTAEGARGLTGFRGDADEAAAVLLSLLEG